MHPAQGIHHLSNYFNPPFNSPFPRSWTKVPLVLLNDALVTKFIIRFQGMNHDIFMFLKIQAEKRSKIGFSPLDFLCRFVKILELIFDDFFLLLIHEQQLM